MSSPAETAQRFVNALLARESRAALVTPDFRFHGIPFSGMLLPLEGASPDAASERLAESGITLRFATVEPAGPERAWVEVVWSHDAQTGHGSAGLQWVVFTVDGDRVREVRFFRDREDARAFAFGG